MPAHIRLSPCALHFHLLTWQGPVDDSDHVRHARGVLNLHVHGERPSGTLTLACLHAGYSTILGCWRPVIDRLLAAASAAAPPAAAPAGAAPPAALAPAPASPHPAPSQNHNPSRLKRPHIIYGFPDLPARVPPISPFSPPAAASASAGASSAATVASAAAVVAWDPQAASLPAAAPATALEHAAVTWARPAQNRQALQAGGSPSAAPAAWRSAPVPAWADAAQVRQALQASGVPVAASDAEAAAQAPAELDAAQSRPVLHDVSSALVQAAAVRSAPAPAWAQAAQNRHALLARGASAAAPVVRAPAEAMRGGKRAPSTPLAGYGWEEGASQLERALGERGDGGGLHGDKVWLESFG